MRLVEMFQLEMCHIMTKSVLGEVGHFLPKRANINRFAKAEKDCWSLSEVEKQYEHCGLFSTVSKERGHIGNINNRNQNQPRVSYPCIPCLYNYSSFRQWISSYLYRHVCFFFVQLATMLQSVLLFLLLLIKLFTNIHFDKKSIWTTEVRNNV